MKIDLGTEIQLPSNNMNLNAKRYLNKNMNTFQQSSQPEALFVNDRADKPPRSASPAQAPEVYIQEKVRKTEKVPLVEKKLSPNAIYEEIHFQMNKIKDGERHARAKVYLSLKTDLDMTFSVTLSGSVTSAVYETISMANTKKEHSIIELIKRLKECHGNDLMVGRLKYKPRNGYKTDMHKNIIPHVLIAVYPTEMGSGATLYMLGQEYVFEMTNTIAGKQKEYYDVVGTYRKIPNVMNDEDAFE
jgi:hypothetical protein